MIGRFTQQCEACSPKTNKAIFRTLTALFISLTILSVGSSTQDYTESSEYDNNTIQEHLNVTSPDYVIIESLQTKTGEQISEQELNETTSEPIPTEKLIDLTHLSPEFLNCSSYVSLDPEFYEELENGSVYVEEYRMTFDSSNYLVRDDLLFLCSDFYKEHEEQFEEKFSLTLSIVSITCVGISTFCIVLHIIMFILLRRLRNLPGYILLSLCLALLAAYVCSFIHYELSEHIACREIGMVLLYFFLSSFFWMNTMSYDVWKSIRMATAKLRSTADRPIKIQILRYSVYSWGMPLMIILSAIIVHNTTSNIKYQLIFNTSTCWFAYRQALSVYFALPLFALIALNVFFFLSSFFMISRSAMSSSASGTSQKGSDLWSRLFLSMRLGSVMGLMWIFGIIAAATDREWLWYVYNVCNALQGVFIFFSFTVSERARKVFWKAFQKRNCSFMPTQSSTVQSQRSSAM